MLDIVGDFRKVRFELKRRFGAPIDMTCQTKNGLMTFSSLDRAVGRRLYCRRHWSWDLLQRCQRLLVAEGLLEPMDNDLLINVGANIGCILVPLLRNGFFRKGIAFEPAPSNARYLRQNISQNGLSDRAQVFQLGLSHEDRISDFELSPRNAGDHRVRSCTLAEPHKSAYGESQRQVISVPLARLDNVITERQLLLGDRYLIWVDIQGHEGYFLQGARQSLRPGVPVVMECWPYGINRSGMSGAEFCAQVGELFETFYVWQRRRWQKRSTTDFNQVYQRYARGTSGTDIVLVAR